MAVMGFEEEEEEKWVKHYSSNHQILLVGEGDFSFSLSLARSFGSASNILATSLDSYDVVIKKYKKAKSNLESLGNLGASLLHGVNATMMKMYPNLRMRKFDRIIFNFPHAGFHGKEDDIRIIRQHRTLVYKFFRNARSMLRPNGEIHVNHKTTPPFCLWNIEELATQNSLALVECVEFNIEDYPGYKNKRGDGARCDLPFPLGKCSTFKFRLSNTSNNMPRATSRFDPMHRRFEQFQAQNPSTSFEFNESQMASVSMFTHNSNQPLQRPTYLPSGHIREKYLNFDYVGLPLETSVRNREDYLETFPQRFGYTEEIRGRTHLGMVSPVSELGHERTWNRDIHILPESNRRTYYDIGSPVNELGHERTWNRDLHILPESNRRTYYDMGSPVNELRFIFNRETTTMLPRRTSNHDMHILPEFGRRTYYDVDSPVPNELRYGFNRDMTTGRTLNHDIRMLADLNRRTIENEGFPVNELTFRLNRDSLALLPGRTLNHDIRMLREFDQRTCHDASFPVNELRLDFNRDRPTMPPGRILDHDMYTLPDFGCGDIRRLVREYGN